MSTPTSWLRRLFPPSPNFGQFLAEQCESVRRITDGLATTLGDANHQPDLAAFETMEEDSNGLRLRNLEALNKAFSTPYDREDIYRAADILDGIVLHTMRTVREMEALDLSADATIIDLASIVQTGVVALDSGFSALAQKGPLVAQDVEVARRTERLARRRYDSALASLYQQVDPIEIMKRREIYHHLADGAALVRKAAGVLGDIAVKSS